MPRKVEFSYNEGPGTPTRMISAEFEDAEWESLVAFRQCTKELAETDLMRFGAPGQLKFNYKKGEGFSYSVSLPEPDKFLSFLHRLRPFILQKESTHFNRVCNMLSMRIRDDHFRRLLDVLRDYFSADRMRPIFISVNNVIINSEETLQKWLNAFEYHRDPDKKREIEALHTMMPLEASRALFAMMLYDKARSIMILSNIIGVLGGEEASFSLSL